MGVSTRMVAPHLRRVLTKPSVSSRLDLMARLYGGLLLTPRQFLAEPANVELKRERARHALVRTHAAESAEPTALARLPGGAALSRGIVSTNSARSRVAKRWLDGRLQRRAKTVHACWHVAEVG